MGVEGGGHQHLPNEPSVQRVLRDRREPGLGRERGGSKLGRSERESSNHYGRLGSGGGGQQEGGGRVRRRSSDIDKVSQRAAQARQQEQQAAVHAKQQQQRREVWEAQRARVQVCV